MVRWGDVSLSSASQNYTNTDTTAPTVSAPLIAASLVAFDGTQLVRPRADAGKFLNVAGAPTASLVATPTVSVSPAYSSGDLIGGKLSLANAIRVAGLGGTITNAILTDKGKQNAAIDIVLFSTDPTNTTFTDNGVLTIADADLINIIGVIPVTSYASFNDNSVGYINNVAIPFKLASGTTLYACLVSRGTPTYTSTSDLQLTLGIIPD